MPELIPEPERASRLRCHCRRYRKWCLIRDWATGWLRLSVSALAGNT
jgi:hypothetical protein